MDEPRQEVLWFGETPSASIVREFRVTVALICDEAPLRPLAAAAAAVFAFPKRDRNALFAAATRHARTLVDYGLRVGMLAADDGTIGRPRARIGSVLGLLNVDPARPSARQPWRSSSSGGANGTTAVASATWWPPTSPKTPTAGAFPRDHAHQNPVAVRQS